MNQSRDITFQVNGNNVNGYLASAEQPGPGVIVLHAWWGLTPFFKQLCDRLANAGFTAFAPDLHNGKTASTIAEAQALMAQSNETQVRSIVNASVDQVHNIAQINNKLGVIGFSMGAAWGMELATMKPDDIAATIVFYGIWQVDFTKTHSAFQGHFAETDDYEPVEQIPALETAIRAASLSADFHTYPNTTHWFFEDNRPDAYNAPAAQLAWQRTLDFLHQHLD